MSLTFCPISSGSSGNCTYIGYGDARILIDAGTSGIRVERALSALGVQARDLSAVFVTHEHIDHISGVGILSRRFDLPIYATPSTWRYFERHGVLGRVPLELRKTVGESEPASIGEMLIKPFSIPHDASAPVGYNIYAGNLKASVATDIGHPTDSIRESLRDSDIILLESNHDLDMLLNGPYPKALKDRINGSRGHLSNSAAAELLAEVMSERLKHVFLGHLSEENNSPLIAFCAVAGILEKSAMQGGKNLSLAVAERHDPSRAVEL